MEATLALENIVTVDITLNTTSVSRQGFGTPIFISAHSYFPERTRGYPSLSSAKDDIPEDSPTYKALQSFFSQQPSVPLVFIGRRDVDETIITPDAIVVGKVYSFGLATGTNTAVTVSHTAVVADTVERVVDAWVTYLASSPITGVTVTKVGTGTTAKLKLVSSSDPLVISSLVRVTDSYVTTETASQVLSAIEEENTDWYFVTAEDHTETFVLQMAEAIEARTKIYGVSVQQSSALYALTDPATDILGKLKASNYFRTLSVWHHEADAKFVECAFIGYNAPFDAGSVTWNLERLQGVSASADPVTGKRLTFTQKNNLASRNANFVDLIDGVVATREGKVAAGEWIDLKEVA